MKNKVLNSVTFTVWNSFYQALEERDLKFVCTKKLTFIGAKNKLIKYFREKKLSAAKLEIVRIEAAIWSR